MATLATQLFGAENRSARRRRWRNGRGRAPNVEVLEERRLLFAGPLPTSFEPIAPDGSLIHSAIVSESVNGVGETDSFTVALDGEQTLSVVVDPDSGLAPVVRLRDPSNALLGTALATTGEDAVLQTIPITVPGTYTIEVSVLGPVIGGIIGDYTVQAIINSAVENESHDGASNDSQATAQDLEQSMLSLGSGDEQRGAVIGTRTSPQAVIDSDNFESGALDGQWSTSSSDPGGRIQVTGAFGTAAGSFALLMDRNPDGAYNNNEAIWTVDLSGLTDATLTFSHSQFNDENDPLPANFSGSVNGDGVSISDDGSNWHTVFMPGPQASGEWVPITVDLGAEAAAAGMSLGANFQIKFQQYDNFPLTTDGRGYDEISITAPIAPDAGDWYQFTLDDGESATIALTEDAPDSLTLELFDDSGSGVPLAVGHDGANNVSQIVSNFVDPTTDSAPNTYLIRVAGVPPSATEYTLVVTRDADFDTESNDDFNGAQDIGDAAGALGHVKGNVGGSSEAEGGAQHAGVASFGAVVEEDRHVEPQASITIPFNSQLNFDEAMALLATPGGGLVQQPAAVEGLAEELSGPIPVLQSFAGPSFTGYIPPDSIAAAGPEQIVTLINTDFAIYDKATGAELFRQNMNGSSGFFGEVGATSTVFDPWVLFDTDTDRFFAIGIDVASDVESNLFLAVSTDATPTSGADWHKYKIDFTNTPSPTLGSEAHFPDYPKMGVNDDAIFISGNYFPIDAGTGVYAGITAIEKAPLLSGGPANVVYEEFFNGFSVFPMTQYDSGSTQYFAEAFTGGGTSIKVHAVTDVLTTPTRTTASVAVPSYGAPPDVPQLGGGVGADSLDARVMTGVWRDGSMWFGHAATDPAIGDGEALVRWYEIATNDFPISTASLVQAGNVDPGPDIWTWMPAVSVDGEGNMAVAFSIGGPNQFYSAAFTGRLAEDPLGTTVLPVTEYVTGQGNYVRTDNIGRNRWGDYSGLAIDPLDDATFWAFNEYATNLNSWATQVASFQLEEPSDEDWYRFEVIGGDDLVVQSFVPASGDREFTNDVEVLLELYDPDGEFVADGTGSLVHEALKSGSYRLRVQAGPNTEGTYFVGIDGATGASQGPQVITTDPADGAKFPGDQFPTSYTLDFSQSLLLPTVEAGDLTIGGLPALSVTVIDGDTLEFEIDPAVNAGEGVYSVQLAAGAVLGVNHQPNFEFLGTFEVDTTGPVIVGTQFNGGSLLPSHTIAPGPFVFEATFNEDLVQVGSARRGAYTPGTDDVILVDTSNGTIIQPESVAYDPGTDVFSAQFGFLAEGDYSLTLVSGDNAFEDLVGNDLDGEPIGAGIDGTPTGDGVPGGDYVVDFIVDISAEIANPFERLNPLGGLMSASMDNSGLINVAGDADDFEFLIETSETITAVAVPDDPTVTLSLELPGVTGPFTAPGPGEAVILPIAVVAGTGTQAVRVSGDARTNYSLDIYRNAAIERQVGDSGPGNELAIDPSYIALGSGRFGAVGNITPIEVEVDSVVWGVRPATGEIIKIDPVTGLVLDAFAAPDGLAPEDTQIGLSLAQNGSSLLYVNSDVDPTTLYRLDPDTGAVLSTESLSGVVIDGLGFESLGGTATVVNGSFETGDFTGWTVATTGTPFVDWTVSGAGSGAGFGLASTEPQDGSFVAWNGFDGAGPMEFTMFQDVNIPAGAALATLEWSDRVQWDFTLGGFASQPRLYDVELRDPTTNAVLATLFSFSTNTQDVNPTGNTGFQTHSADVSSYIGQTVRLFFREQIPQSSTGPAQIEFDAIRVNVVQPGNEFVFLSHDLTDVRRQQGFSGSESAGWATGAPTGGLGGDDVGRQFGFFDDGFIHEYDPFTDTDSFLSTLPAPAADIEGLAFDGRQLFAATASGDLYTLDPDDGNVLNVVAVPEGALLGLGAVALSAGPLGFSANASLEAGTPLPGAVDISGTPLSLGFSDDGSFVGPGIGAVHNGVEYLRFGTFLAGYTVAFDGATFTNNAPAGSTAFPVSLEDISSGDQHGVRVTGNITADVAFERVVYWNDGDDFALVTTTLTNNSTAPLNNVALLENQDPDPGGVFSTNNDVVLDGDLVIGAGSAGAMALGSQDERAVVSAESFVVTDPFSIIDSPVDPNGASGDIAINLAFDLGVVEPGDSVVSTFALVFGANATAVESTYADIADQTEPSVTFVLPDVDEYTLDLTGSAGHSIDIVFDGQGEADFTDVLLELIDTDGTTVLATGAAMSSETETFLVGDINRDHRVDIGDFTLLADAFGATGTNMPEDLNGDGVVDIGDFTLWADNAGAYGAGGVESDDGDGESANTQFDVGILDFVVPADGVYTVRVRSTQPGDYGLVVTEALVFDSEPNDEAADSLRSLNAVSGALGFLDATFAEIAGELEFDLNPDESFIDFSGTVLGAPAPTILVEQLPGSLRAAFDGSMTVDFTGDSIAFLGAIVDAIEQPGPFSPGNAPADAAGNVQFDGLPGSSLIVGAFRELVLSVLSDTLLVDVDGQFMPSPMDFVITGGRIDYQPTGLPADSESLVGGILPNGTTVPGQIDVFDAGAEVMLPIVATIEIVEPNFGFTLVLNLNGQLVGNYQAPGDFIDVYEIDLQDGETIVFSTATPFDSPGSTPANTLDPRLEIRDSAGTPLADDDNSATDGRNAELSFTAPAAGTYQVAVAGVGGIGEYVLHMARSVGLDVKPGSDVNPVNLGSNGVLPVALLSEEGFDAATIDLSDLSQILFGSSDVSGRVSPLRSTFEDVDGDGDTDLLFKFSMREIRDANALSPSGGQVELTAMTYSGMSVIAYDVITIVPHGGHSPSTAAESTDALLSAEDGVDQLFALSLAWLDALAEQDSEDIAVHA